MAIPQILVTAKTLLMTSLPVQITTAAVVILGGTSGAIVYKNNTSQGALAPSSQMQGANGQEKSASPNGTSSQAGVKNENNAQEPAAQASERAQQNANPTPGGSARAVNSSTQDPQTPPASNPTNTADTISPSVSITSPANGSTFKYGTLGGYITDVTANATDNKGVTKVEFYKNGALKSTDTSAPYAWTWSYGNEAIPATTTFTMTAKAYDAAGNVATSPAVTYTVTIDSSIPTVSITNPANGSTISGLVIISATANDSEQGIAKVTFRIVQGGVTKATYEDTSAPYTYSFDTTTIPNGYTNIVATATDNYGTTTLANHGITVSN